MPPFLFHLLAPGEKIPYGANQFTLGYEGLSWGWAFFIFVGLVAIVAWSYRRFAKELGFFTRLGLIILRSILLGILLLLLVRPVLLATIEESSRRPLIVLLDTTQSMGLTDHRATPEDLARAAIAMGQADPAGGLKQSVSAADADKIKGLSRRELLEGLAANAKLNLWPRLSAHADLNFYGFGRKLSALGELKPPGEGKLTPDESSAFFHALRYDENLTAIGDGLRDLLDTERGEPISGILLITDGANNSGSSPIEAAATAKEDGVPLFIYGIGVTSPQDIMVAGIDAPTVGNVKEKLNVTIHVKAQRMSGRQATIQLKANGKVVDEQPLTFRADGEQEVNMGYIPDVVGVANLEAFVPPLPEEAVKNNNYASTQVRIEDNKIKVLIVEEEPSWDFQYLLLTLQRDRRIQLKAVLIKGDPDLATQPDSPFLPKIPDDKQVLDTNDLIIIGDVDPADLGEAHIKLLNDWVSNLGGGLIFLAGPKFDPNAYKPTALDPMLPVETKPGVSTPYDSPVQLKLTSDGASSPMLQVSTDPTKNAQIWTEFPGVHWTGWVGKARPAAQVLLTDPTAARATEGAPMPVVAQQSYGKGQTLYIGLRETYRWRSHEGEKFYVQIWDQIIQELTAGHRAASALVQLKTNRPTYLTGDKVKISGRIFQSGFVPVTDAEIPGILTFTPAAKAGQPGGAPQTREIRLQQVADHAGDYQAETVVPSAGEYSYSTTRDPAISVKFLVSEPRVEMADIAMNEKLLRAMAAASGGSFIREEDLHGLPELITSKSTEAVTFKKIPLSFAPILLILMILAACGEWLWRRKLELK